jgi:hypothetical protein
MAARPTASQEITFIRLSSARDCYRDPSGTARRTTNMSMSCDTFCEIARIATLPDSTGASPVCRSRRGAGSSRSAGRGPKAMGSKRSGLSRRGFDTKGNLPGQELPFQVSGVPRQTLFPTSALSCQLPHGYGAGCSRVTRCGTENGSGNDCEKQGDGETKLAHAITQTGNARNGGKKPRSREPRLLVDGNPYATCCSAD